MSTSRLTGIVELRPEDGVVVVRAGTLVEDLLKETAGHGLTLPLAIGLARDVSQRYGTVGGLLAAGLPHAHEAG
ncbi:FAD-binding protein, partial [Acinetobacter baumannii]